MIISHQHQLIFIKPRKVAGTSFEIALSKYLNGDDIISPLARADEKIRAGHGFAGPANYQFNKSGKLFGRTLPDKFYNHMPAWLVRLYIGAKMFDHYTKISIVRNPWDRAVSLFFYKNRISNNDITNFTSYFQANKKVLDINTRNYRIGSKVVIDQFIRYEHFAEDLGKLEAMKPGLIGLAETLKSISAKTSSRDKALTVPMIFAQNPEVDAMVRSINAWEIATFGYELGAK